MSTTQQDAAAANTNPSGTIKTNASIAPTTVVVKKRDIFNVSTLNSRRDGLFRWIPAGFRVSDDDILQRCGLDTLTFLRFLRLGQKLALLAVGCSAVLFPLYATAAQPLTNRGSIDPLTRISVSNLPERSDRLWAPTIVAFIMATYAMRLLLEEYKLYVRCRHEVLGRMEAPQYSVLVSDLPLQLRTRQTLGEIYVQDFSIVDPKRVCGAGMCHVGDAGESTLKKLKSRREIRSIDDAQTQLAIQVEEQERELGSFDDDEELQLPESEGGWKKVAKKSKQDGDPKKTPLIDRRGRAEQLQSSFGGEDEDEIDEKKARRHEREMSQDEREQALQSKDPECMAVMPAPHVDDINWDNIGLRYRTRTLGMLVSSLISATIVLFWTIPTAFVASLATVESLRRALPFLNKTFDEYPILQDIFKQIAPLALVALSALAPIVFNFLSGREGHPSNTEVRAALFSKLAYFQLVQIFFVTVIVGTILDSLKEILDQPKKLVSMLGRSMPQQSTFFISYVIVQTGLGLVLELLRVVPLLLSALFALLAPKHTRRERNSPWLGLRDIAQTDPFDPTNHLADCFLVLLVTLTFAPIAPLVCYFTWFFFLVAEIVYRRQVLCVYKPTCFALGAYWPRMFKFCIIALVVAQLTLIGILSLKKAATPPIFIIALIVIVLLFNYNVLTLYPPVAKYLPLTDCVRLDTARGLRDPTAPKFFFLDNVYRQPALNQRVPIRADYRMLANDYSDETALTSPEIHSAEDQHLFTSVV
ncbi:Calcium permeable stress-gated cation channel 1, N-terminal transmembrane domain [Phytophthora cactorum]|nr:Calcium permeable stress-gated cation channel 1, N-terminal transmembrane domain [Phytophthora cactorum]